MKNEEKLSIITKLAKTYIILFLKDYVSSEQLSNIENLFKNCPVVLEDLNSKYNEIDRNTTIGGIAQEDKIIINTSDIEKININTEIELNKVLGTIIHEYAHKIKALNSTYGEMFEESFASIFAEICINNARLISSDKNNIEPFEMLSSVNYQKYESQVRALLYILKQNNLDKQLIAEYIAGSQDKFKQKCIEIFGYDFNNYFNVVSSRDNKDSEHILIEIITKYIKEKGLNISNYWKDNSNLTQDNLYFKGSPTLAKAVVNSGSENFSSEELESYKAFEYSAKVANENDNFIKNEKISRVREYIEKNFSLNGKSLEEIYDTILELCSAYIQHKNKDSEESKIFIQEIQRIISDIDDFKTKFVNLRVAGLDKSIFENMNLESITYDDITSSMNKILQIGNQEDNSKIGGIKR